MTEALVQEEIEIKEVQRPVEEEGEGESNDYSWDETEFSTPTTKPYELEF